MATTPLQSLLDSLSARLANLETKLGVEGPPPPVAAAASDEEDARQVKAFDAYCRECLDPFLASCEALGPEATACGAFVKQGWMGMRAYISKVYSF